MSIADIRLPKSVINAIRFDDQETRGFKVFDRFLGRAQVRVMRACDYLELLGVSANMYQDKTIYPMDTVIIGDQLLPIYPPMRKA